MKNCWFILVLTALFSLPVSAEQYQRIKDVEVHYSAFNSTFLTPKVARSYKLKRNGYSAVLNISVLDTYQPGKAATSAVIQGSVKNLLGQTRKLTFRQVMEGSAIYYITEFPISDEEQLTFTIDVDAGLKGKGKINFTQKFYVEE
ncbi:DUF4426 domain-containing protein [Vibrio sonorensis]|uniref:DUF4426 domain-containing protein n=1 Tax=Vibrio sonorensis TaxID=1004316 RepID=UPI0008DA363D|nr:DUF4426 domain-containing protein [Vibrio sonorensis]